MKKIFALLAALAAIGLVACAKNKAADAAHNSKNSVKWDGVYTGTIPAADTMGIYVQIVLNPDQTYEIRYQHLGEPESDSAAGVFAWDKTGSVIKLDAAYFPPYYRVGENNLTQLDMLGKTITGILADNYVLRKVH